jgi:hypothetical protein
MIDDSGSLIQNPMSQAVASLKAEINDWQQQLIRSYQWHVPSAHSRALHYCYVCRN